MLGCSPPSGKKPKAWASASDTSAMDLEIVGRHALLFDDDATAEVVNSGGSLVPWAAVGAADLLLDRHDVRHLLDRVPPRPRRPYSAAILSIPSSDGVSEAELDRERYLDLPSADGGDEDVGSGDAPPSGINISFLRAWLNSLFLLYFQSCASISDCQLLSCLCCVFAVFCAQVCIVLHF